MGVQEKIAEIEEQMAKTQKNKATEHHLGLLKAKLAKLRQSAEEGGKKGGSSQGFDVKKSGHSTVVFIGLPSTGKSTLLNALTGSTQSKSASYAFTTLSCIPGMMIYNGAQIQLLDLPGIIAGAKAGRGRGKEVLAVARNADLILLVLDVFDPTYGPKLKAELEGIGLRLDQKPANVHIHKLVKGGLNIVFTKPQAHLTDRLITEILKEYGIHSGNVTINDRDVSVDQFIDAVVGTRRFVPSLTVVNKVDLVKPEFVKSLKFSFVPVSAENNYNIEKLREEIFRKLNLIRVYTKPRGEEGDDVPLMLKSGSTVEDACAEIHRDLKRVFKHAEVWGPSAKHPGQKVGLSHVLKEGDRFRIAKK